MFLQNNGNRIKCYQNAIKATYDTRKSQCLCGFPGLLSLFVLHRRGRFGSEIIKHAIDPGHFRDNAVDKMVHESR